MFRSLLAKTRVFQLSRQYRLLVVFSLAVFFWQIFDGIITYFTPIIIIQRGFSTAAMGLIIGSSSIFGAFLDFILAKILKGSNYLRIFLIVLGISFFYPLTLWYSQNIFLYLLAMFIWGLYWDLYRFVSFDFVAHNSSPEDNCFHFSFISLFRSVALLLAPLIAGLLVVDQVEFGSILIPSLFLILASVFYTILLSLSPRQHTHSQSIHTHRHSFSWLREFKLLISLSSHILPIFLMNIILVTFDSSFWTLAPLLGPQFPGFNDFGGLFMAAYMLPGLFNSLVIEKLVDRFGKLNVSFLSFIISGVFLIPLFLLKTPTLILLFVFLASIINSSAWTAVSGVFADLIESHPSRKKEYESLYDLSVNVGFIIGPILSGFLALSSNLILSISQISTFAVVSALMVFIFLRSKSDTLNPLPV